jgi:hypothetical protein
VNLEALTRLGSRLRRTPAPGSHRAVERVYLPVAVATPLDCGEGARSKRKPAGSERRVFIVERVLGYAWAVACDPAAISTVDDEPAALPARLTTEECRRSIEAMASRSALAFRHGPAAEAVGLEPPRAASYPFDLRYRRARSGRLEFEALDAITGKRAGGPLRAAIAAALVDADRRCAAP